MWKLDKKTKYNTMSLGAGVQSSALAMMFANGDLEPRLDFAVFADTGAEPPAVYEYLETLKEMVANAKYPFPIYTVSAGNLTDDSLTPRVRQKPSKYGEIGDKYMRRLIPIYGINDAGKKSAMIMRNCTANYKITPINRFIKEKCGIKRGQKELAVTQVIGISWDEIQRAKESANPWMQHRFPLLEMRMSRKQCLEYMEENGLPEPPRSACYYCPFHSDSEWKRMRDEDPDSFQKAIEFDRELRRMHDKYPSSLRMSIFIHNSCQPLEDVDFTGYERDQMALDFGAECEGMCGM